MGWMGGWALIGMGRWGPCRDVEGGPCRDREGVGLAALAARPAPWGLLVVVDRGGCGIDAGRFAGWLPGRRWAGDGWGAFGCVEALSVGHRMMLGWCPYRYPGVTSLSIARSGPVPGGAIRAIRSDDQLFIFSSAAYTLSFLLQTLSEWT